MGMIIIYILLALSIWLLASMSMIAGFCLGRYYESKHSMDSFKQMADQFTNNLNPGESYMVMVERLRDENPNPFSRQESIHNWN